MNNCLLDAIAARTGRNPQALRDDLAKNMEDNFETLANQASDIDLLELYKAKALYLGAGQKNEKNRTKEKILVQKEEIVRVDNPDIVNANEDSTAKIPSNKLHKELFEELVPQFLYGPLNKKNVRDGGICKDGFLEVSSVPLSIGTVTETDNLRADKQKSSAEVDNYQLQIGGSKYVHQRKKSKFLLFSLKQYLYSLLDRRKHISCWFCD